MSATTTAASEEFVESLTTSPDLQETARERGLAEAADRAGYDLTVEEIEAGLREAIDGDLPDHDDDTSREAMYCTFTMCGCA